MLHTHRRINPSGRRHDDTGHRRPDDMNTIALFTRMIVERDQTIARRDMTIARLCRIVDKLRTAKLRGR